MNAVTELDNAGRAAVMMMLLDEHQATSILSQLEPDELRILGDRMCGLGDIDPTTISRTVNDFLGRAEQDGMPATDRARQVQSLMQGAVGPLKADNLMRSILPQEKLRPSSIELAKWLDPEVLGTLVEGEHPQAIAVLLVQLDPQVAARVLHALSPQAQSEVVHRVATLGAISADAIAMLEELLEQRIAAVHGTLPLQLGGPSEAAEIINRSGKSIEKQVMGHITKVDRMLARKIEAEMFRFEHLFVLDTLSMGALLREVDGATLIDALKGIGEPERDCFFAAMSSRAADGVRDEIESRGRLKLAEVESAQKEMIDVARRLAADGVIVFGSSGEDEIMSSLPAEFDEPAGAFRPDFRFGGAPAVDLAPRRPDPAETAFEEGYAKGLGEGLAQAQAQAALDDAARGRIELGFARLADAEERRFEERLRETVLVLCERTLAPLAVDGDALTGRIGRALGMLRRNEDQRVLRLHPEDLALVQSRLPEHLRVEPDPTLTRGELRIETAEGGVEDGPGQWRRALMEALGL